MILLFIGLIMFIVGIVGALFNMSTIFNSSTLDNPKGLFLRHAAFGSLYIIGVVLMIIAGILLVI